MLDLDREVMNNFYKSVHSDADEVSKVMSVLHLVPKYSLKLIIKTEQAS